MTQPMDYKKIVDDKEQRRLCEEAGYTVIAGAWGFIVELDRKEIARIDTGRTRIKYGGDYLEYKYRQQGWGLAWGDLVHRQLRAKPSTVEDPRE